MVWNKKEDKDSLPDLPPLDIAQHSPPVNPKMQSNYQTNQEINKLPTFPDSSQKEDFSQSLIKGVVDSSNSNFKEVQSKSLNPSNIKTVEMEEWAPSITSNENTAEQKLPEFKPEVSEENLTINEPPETLEAPPKIKNKDIFVKLDRFYTARKSLVEAQEKLKDVDDLLRRIRETKMREEQELNSWQKELEHVKARLNDVALNLFEKVD